MIEYTLIITTYNMDERVDKCIDFWSKILSPPKYFIVLDDGSTYKSDRTDVTVYYFNHINNISKTRNFAVDHLKTNWFICSEPSIFPYPGTMSTLCAYSKEDSTVCGQFISVDRFEFPEIRNTKCYCITNDYWSAEVTIRNRWTFPYYNEIYEGWGGEDNDMQYRFILGKNCIYFSPNINFIHWNHHRESSFYDEDKVNKNKNILDSLSKKYFAEKITKIEKDKNGNRIIYP